MAVADLKSRNVVALTAELLARYPELDTAVTLAAYAHDGQLRREVRRNTTYRDPYVIHPIRCALRIERWIGPVDDSFPRRARADLLAAALLHDTVEDAPQRIVEFFDAEHDGAAAADPVSTLRQYFGVAVADTVARVTTPKPPAEVGRAQRHRAYLDHLRREVFTDRSARLVKASDLTDNAGSLRWMRPSDKRSTLASKYREPVRELSAILESGALSDRNGARRLRGVQQDLDSILQSPRAG
jgi:(p)ppGpp synthase/HD superfamily hydrolase